MIIFQNTFLTILYKQKYIKLLAQT